MLAALLVAASCHVSGVPPMIQADPVCTPGAYVRMTHKKVCVTKTRPPVTRTMRYRIIVSYGLDPQTFHGELDHRVPFFLGGTTNDVNLWPESGAIPNPKDRLEAYVWRRVCHRRPEPMTVATARRIFKGSWVYYYKLYGLETGKG